MKTILITMAIFCLILLSPSASALGIERAEFFEVEQGSTQSITISLYTSPSESENEFTYEILSDNQDIHDWVTVSPEKFVMPPGKQSRSITVTLTVPLDATLGDRNGELKYAGSRVSGGGTIGYTVATKSVLHFKVVKEGAKKDIDFITLEVKPQILPHEIAKFKTTLKNTGNIPAEFYVSLIIEEDMEEVFKVDSAPMSVDVDLFEDITLYWEPEKEGTYTGCFKIIFDDSVDGVEETTLKSDMFMVIVSNEAVIENEGFSMESMPDPMTILGVLCILAAIVILVLTFKTDKDKQEENTVDSGVLSSEITKDKEENVKEAKDDK